MLKVSLSTFFGVIFTLDFVGFKLNLRKSQFLFRSLHEMILKSLSSQDPDIFYINSTRRKPAESDGPIRFYENLDDSRKKRERHDIPRYQGARQCSSRLYVSNHTNLFIFCLLSQVWLLIKGRWVLPEFVMLSFS